MSGWQPSVVGILDGAKEVGIVVSVGMLDGAEEVGIGVSVGDDDGLFVGGLVTNDVVTEPTVTESKALGLDEALWTDVMNSVLSSATELSPVDTALYKSSALENVALLSRSRRILKPISMLEESSRMRI